MNRRYPPIEVRLLANVVKAANGCWLWSGHKVSKKPNNNYGRIRYNGKNVLAHRVSWELRNGKIKKGLCVCHKCDTPSCVNPDHLFLGSHKENMRDSIKKGRLSIVISKGEKNGRAILTAEQVIAIRADKRTPYRIISQEYGVNLTRISQIKLRKTWKHI